MATHTIAYAYPSSTLARQMRRSATGCYTVTVGSKTTAHATYAEAVACAAALGTEPGRWSMDNPACDLAHGAAPVGDGPNDIPF